MNSRDSLETEPAGTAIDQFKKQGLVPVSVVGDIHQPSLQMDDDEFYQELQRRSQDETGQVRAEDIWNELQSF